MPSTCRNDSIYLDTLVDTESSPQQSEVNISRRSQFIIRNRIGLVIRRCYMKREYIYIYEIYKAGKLSSRPLLKMIAHHKRLLYTFIPPVLVFAFVHKKGVPQKQNWSFGFCFCGSSSLQKRKPLTVIVFVKWGFVVFCLEDRRPKDRKVRFWEKETDKTHGKFSYKKL